jgi:serine/threonine protein kinase
MSISRAFGDHRLVAALGKGGMATVYLALSTKQFGFTKLVVLKVMRDDLGSDEFVQMFLQEARLAARLNHANVVQTYEVSEFEGRPFISMEYLEGQPLSSILSRVGRASVPLGLQIRVLCDALEGLQYAHELTEFDGTPLNLVHRDVSPQNIFVLYTGQTKLLDFGIAKSRSSEQTVQGVLKGKTGYMAPEQVTSEADRRSDLFAIGVTLWEAVAKRRLVGNGEDEVAALTRRVAGKDPTILSVEPETPPALAAIVDKAMATDPNQRYGSARELREALEAYLLSIGGYDSRQVALFVDQAFAEERARLRRQIEEQSKLAPQSDSSLEVHSFLQGAASTASRPSRADSEIRVASMAPSTGEKSFVTDAPVANAKKGPPVAMIAGLAAALLAVGGAVVALRPNQTAPGASQAPSLPTPTQTTAPVETSPVKPEQAEPESYTLTVTSTPAGSKVFEGDALLGQTPLNLTIVNAAVASKPRNLTVLQDGFVPYRLEVFRGSKDQAKHFDLIASKAAQTVPHYVPHRPVTPSQNGNSPPKPAPEPAAAASAPSRIFDAPDTRGLRPIDQANPWEKK